MPTLLTVLRVLHVVTAILMAWPYYALVAVNQRARLGPPLGDRADLYLENIVKNRTVPCFVFQATALVTGLALIPAQGLGFNALWVFPLLGAKLVLLLLIGGLLSYVHLSLQPRIDELFAQAQGAPLAQELAARVAVLRLRRKRLASACFAVVLVVAMFGVAARAGSPAWLTLLLVAAAALLTWRAYRSTTPYGWW